MPIQVGILGYGALGKHLYDTLLTQDDFEVKFIWNRTKEALAGLPAGLALYSLDDVPSQEVDLVVEVSHPSISAQLAAKCLRNGSDFFVGSPTAMSDVACEKEMRDAAEESGRALYIPSGALWGAADIQGLANRGLLHALTITMKKHPASFRLPHAETDTKRAAAEKITDAEVVLYEGSVRGLCPIAPNNVNTMACAAMAAHTLGFDNTTGRLVADTRLLTHEVEITALGKPDATTGAQLKIHVVRSSPAPPGAVTSKATFGSFVESLLKARGRGPGVHFV